jgi:hypothetical protein
MMTAAQPYLGILLGLLIALLVMWLGLYTLMAQYKRRYAERTTRIARQLVDATKDVTTAEQIAVQFSPEDPPPYGPLVRDLKLRLQRVRDGQESCGAQLRTLHQLEPQPPARVLQRFTAVFGQMRDWRQHLQSADALGQQIITLQKQVTGAQNQAEQMRTLPLGVAGRVRNVLSVTDRATAICLSLQQAGVCGDSLDSLVAAVKTHNRAIDTLPDFFKQGTDDIVLSQATPESTRDAWQKLSKIEKPVYDALRRAQQWQSDYNEARSMVGVMQTEVAAAERILNQLPVAIDASRQHEEFNELKGAAGVIERTWRAPEVHSLAELANAASKQVATIQHLSTSVLSLHKNHQAFEQALAADEVLMQRIETMMESLTRTQFSPMRWEHSAEEFQRLHAVMITLGDTTLIRNPARVITDLDTALDLGLQAETLEAHLSDVRDAHKELLALLACPELQTPEEWFHDAAALSIDASRYAQENWQDSDKLANLKTDAAALLKQEQNIQRMTAGHLIPEGEILVWIDLASVYLRDRRGLQTRLDRISRTLHSIERAERLAQTTLTQALGALSHVDRNTAQTITAAPVVHALGDVVALGADGTHLSDLLEDRTSGKVIEKADAINEWADQCVQALRALYQTVRVEHDAARQTLVSQVDALVAIAPFDTEPSMLAAQQLLNEVPARPIGGKGEATRDGANGVPALVEQTNGSIGRYASVVEALDDLEQRVVVQVEPRVARLDSAHAAAWEKLKELETLQRQTPYIKPLQLVCSEADQLLEAFKQAEAGLDDMNKTGRTVKSVVGRLDSLIQQFQYVANHGASAQADLERDLSRLQTVWEQYGLWVRQLKRYRDMHASDKPLVEVMNIVLDDINEHFADIQRRYKGHPLPLDNACRELELLLFDTRRDVEVQRDNGIELISVQNIMAV